MKNNRCLFCYLPLEKGHADFHEACSKKIFSIAVPPVLPYSENQMNDLAWEVIRSQSTVTGVQTKVPLDLQAGENKNEPKRLTIVGLWGDYILKPPTSLYPQMPEVEDLTMHLAELARIAAVPHSLIRMQSGNLAYITRRVDRTKGGKLHMEDMCQLTERLTEQKYHGSYEQIAGAIVRFSVHPVLDVINFYEQVLFSFLTGNADMHLKNFSLYDRPGIGYSLVPAYDLLATALVNPEDKEELALTLNGKKRNFTKKDFTTAFTTAQLGEKQQSNIFTKFEKAMPAWMDLIDISFLDAGMKKSYRRLVTNRHQRLH
jgi:serine/threonine-protein kinase HipA